MDYNTYSHRTLPAHMRSRYKFDMPGNKHSLSHSNKNLDYKHIWYMLDQEKNSGPRSNSNHFYNHIQMDSELLWGPIHRLGRLDMSRQ